MAPGEGEGRAARRAVSPLSLLALGVNGIVGVGIFFAPASVAGSAPGLASVLVFAVTGLALVPVALAFAALGRRFDEDGGPVVFARAAFGDRVAFLVGWIAYVSAVLSTAAVAVGLTRATAPGLGVTGEVGLRLAAVAVVASLALVAAMGIRVSAGTWTALTVLKLLPLLALLAVAAFAGSGRPAPGLGSPEVSWLRAGLTVMFAYQGFEIVPVVAGQARRSTRAVPAATVGSLLVAIALYVGLVWACVAALPSLASAEAPVADAAAVYGGVGLGRAVTVGTSVSALGICFGMIVTTPRYLSALASGGRRLGDLDRTSPRGVPGRALLVTWALVTGLVASGDLAELFALSSIAVLMQYGVTAAALAILSLRRERGLGPRDGWPALPTLALGLVLVVFGATAREGLVAAGTLASGLLLLALSRKRPPPRGSGAGEGYISTTPPSGGTTM